MENKIYSESVGWISVDEPIHMLFPTFRKIPIERNGIDLRIINCLRNEGFETIRDLLKKYPKELEKQLWTTYNFGPKSLERLKEVLALYGFNLDMRWKIKEKPKNKYMGSQ